MAPKTPILLLIDLQEGLVTPPPHANTHRSTPALEANVAYLLRTWRAHGWPVLHVQHDDVADLSNPIGATHPETFPLHACAQPRAGEPLFVKHVGSAFVGTTLEGAVKEAGGGPIVVAGMDGSQCVNNTTRHGVDLGYEMVVVADACASLDKEDWPARGDVVPAEEWHSWAMAMLDGDAKVVRKASDVLEELGLK